MEKKLFALTDTPSRGVSFFFDLPDSEAAGADVLRVIVPDDSEVVTKDGPDVLKTGGKEYTAQQVNAFAKQTVQGFSFADEASAAWQR